MSKQFSRNHGIDLLRIISMYLVLILHILGQGGVIGTTERFTGQYNMAWLLEIMAYCAVNCYGLISGYVGIDGKYKYTNLIMSWLQVLFYTVVITLIFWAAKPEAVTTTVVIRACTPVMSKCYWYFSSYVGLFLLMPVLNIAIRHLNKKQMQALLFVFFLFFSAASTFGGSAAFTLGGGYTTIWLVILYIIGAYLKRYGWESFSGKKALGLYVICVAFTWIEKVGALYVTNYLFDNPRSFGYLVNYVSPTILLISVILLVACSKMSFSEIASKWIAFFSPLAFGVYLIHVNPLVWEYVMKGLFCSYAAFPVWKMVAAVLGTAVMMLVGCMLIDKVRLMIFTKLGLRHRLLELEKRLVGALWE